MQDMKVSASLLVAIWIGAMAGPALAQQTPAAGKDGAAKHRSDAEPSARKEENVRGDGTPLDRDADPSGDGLPFTTSPDASGDSAKRDAPEK